MICVRKLRLNPFSFNATTLFYPLNFGKNCRAYRSQSSRQEVTPLPLLQSGC